MATIDQYMFIMPLDWMSIRTVLPENSLGTLRVAKGPTFLKRWSDCVDA